MGMCYVKSYCC